MMRFVLFCLAFIVAGYAGAQSIEANAQFDHANVMTDP
jgi:hypothetical protein